MSDIQDKIAALPPKCPPFEIVNGEVRYRYPERLFRAEAERDLALEVLRAAIENDGGSEMVEGAEFGVRVCCTVRDYKDHKPDCWVPAARAVLSACGGEGRE
jgi:hypothetical protein